MEKEKGEGEADEVSLLLRFIRAISYAFSDNAWGQFHEGDLMQKEDEFNFMNGNLGRMHRLVARRQLKDRVKFLETLIKLHQPLVESMKVTQKAFQQGVMEGIRQVAEAESKKEEAQTQQETRLVEPEPPHPTPPFQFSYDPPGQRS